MKLIFQNSRHEERLLAECSTLEEIHNEINKFLYEHNFKSYYTRAMPDGDNPNRIILDVGSHTEFFIIDGITFEDYTTDFNRSGHIALFDYWQTVD